MSCKAKANLLPSKNKHYTLMERKVFLQILNNYKNIIENKKSDSVTLKDKEIAWNEICNNYNTSTLISQERNVAQLKKLWTNLKQAQREALTKEKQSHFATGGGPPQIKIDIDPDVANIAPHLMKTAPVSFTSNMSDTQINEKREIVFDLISANRTIEISESDKEDCTLE
ncbi:myb/SANT-like DNA-binding domain-containing protein 3, partial [Temnothorax nylanderi]|uniref:myb/SANT-like DNA-binding domain-containing protein 3 n=1 Tax=Temnothorax nylanderi TaxID=102681 RepID=UPI003A8AF4DE